MVLIQAMPAAAAVPERKRWEETSSDATMTR